MCVYVHIQTYYTGLLVGARTGSVTLAKLYTMNDRYGEKSMELIIYYFSLICKKSVSPTVCSQAHAHTYIDTHAITYTFYIIL